MKIIQGITKRFKISLSNNATSAQTNNLLFFRNTATNKDFLFGVFFFMFICDKSLFFFPMFVFFSALFLLPTVRASKSEDILILDNFEHGEMDYGSEENMIDYALLSLDKKMDLPTSFTICSSVHMNFMTSSIFFYQLYQDDGKPWFSLYIRGQRDLVRFQERVKLRYYKTLTDIQPTLDPVRIMPNSWYHGCTALDTVSGHMLIVVNGHIMIDQIIEEFINSSNERPKSLEGRLSLFKNFNSGIWYQSRQRLTNLNVYASALTVEKMINLTDGENCAGKGDYLSWKEAEWKITGNVDQKSVVKEEHLCFSPKSKIVLFTDLFLDWEECMFFCEKFPSTRSPSVGSDKELLELMKAVERIIMDPATGNIYPGVQGGAYWIPVTDRNIEGQWVDYYTSDPVDIAGVAAGKPNGGRAKNCAIVVTAWGGWQDWACNVNSANILQCPCESKDQMILTMRGLCPNSNIDKYFVPQNKQHDGKILFRGLFKTIIEYQKTDRLWHLKVVGFNSETVATSDASEHSFLLGMSEWTVTGDNVECNKGLPYTTLLKLSGCKDTEFTCHDGQCIKMEERCDQIIHCRDESDEDDCSLLVLKRRYKKKVAPFIYNKTRKEVDPVKVDVSTSLLNVIDISEVNHIIELKFDIHMEWYDYRVDYHNLKTDQALNTLSDEELRSLWIPYIIFQNTDNNEAVELDGIRSTVFISRQSDFRRSGIEFADEMEIFSGASNKINIGQTYSKKFHCNYQLHYFPFDTQVPH